MTAASDLGRLLDALDAVGAARERQAWRVPGRIEVLGKHTDYAGGRSLLAATERGFTLASAPRNDSTVRILDLSRELRIELPLHAELPLEQASWARYPSAVVRRLCRDFPGLDTGADIALSSDLPGAAGLSSSSALVVAIFTALAAANRLEGRDDFRAVLPDPATLATYLGSIESGAACGPFAADFGVGTAGGSEDHTAILLSRHGELGRYSFCPVRPEGSVRLPDELVFVVAGSGVQAAKAGGARERFNFLSATAAELATCWRAATGGEEGTLGAIAARPDGLSRLAEELARGTEPFGKRAIPRTALAARLAQFAFESEAAVPGACAALAVGDLVGFGSWVERSVEHGVRGLDNQVPETLALTTLARELGAAAASPFGAGFGGSVWALVPTGDATAFAGEWLARYRAACPRQAGRAASFATAAAEGLHRLA